MAALSKPLHGRRHLAGPFLRGVLAAFGLSWQLAAVATTPLGDQPVFTNVGVPGNLALTMSVEFPTAVSVAHVDTTFDTTKSYLGYFDPDKCYLYNYSSTESQRYFYPSGSASSMVCTGTQVTKWSGNFLNWATMQTIDPFRWALTGGYRVVDTSSLTLIEKAWASGQGGTNNFPNRTTSGSSTIGSLTPFSASTLKMRVQGLGNKLRFTVSGDPNNSATPYDPAVAFSSATVYEVSARVKVCDSNAASGPMETNCKQYPNGNYKPTGLVQQYADKIRYSAFGYLNDSSLQRDGGVLRARQKFVGPSYTLPGASTVTNLASEWDASTGVFSINPDSLDASDTTAATAVSVNNSGVINYINKFGQINPGSYKTYDSVSELYYAALRYYRNLGNVPEWTSMSGATLATKTTWVDGFPVITNWDDPIQYSCQRNFVLGIGDVNTHADKNVPGTTSSTNEPSKPAAVAADTSVNAVTATNKVGQLHGLGNSLGTTSPFNGCCNNNSALIAGLAFDANGKDIRPDDPSKPQTLGKQTVQTYWLDVLEYSTYKANNQYYLAAKYGGAKLPDNFDPYARTADLPVDWWSTTGETVYGQTKPDNYFVAAKADDMVNGLTRAFASIAANLRAYTTSFSTALPQVALSGTTSYSAQYDASSWTGELSAANSVFDPSTGQPTQTVAWTFSSKLSLQAVGSGWDSGRRIASWNNASNSGVPFRLASLSAAQQAALVTSYRAGSDAADYLNYLRGQSLHEEGSTQVGTSRAYRARSNLVGDIIGSKPRTLGAPAAPLSNASNPGYSSFKTTWANRKTMVYVGSNNGMLHAVDGSLSGASAGAEVFAYVPGSLYLGPTGTPQTNGLASRGNPSFNHRYLVDATPAVFDIDFGRTEGGSGTDWRSVLLGGLGKGGKSYYAIDVTNPAAFSTEAAVAGKVLWEFNDADLGYTYGEPSAVKTKRYGWVLVFASGYNNSDGKGYFFIVNPRTGALLKKIGTGVGAPTAQAGMAHVQAFVLDRTDNTADSVYAGDLLGNLWRLDLRDATGNYPAPTLLARLTDSMGAARPVTSRPSLIVQPLNNRRWVTVGTGRLLDVSDVGSAQSQGMFAIIDGTGLVFNNSAPSGFSFPITPTSLRTLTDLTQPITLNTSTHLGWQVDLGTTAGQGWRVISDPSSYFGSVEFTTMLPSGDACNPSGTSRVYAIDLGTGQSALVADDGVTTIAFSSALTGVATEQRSYAVNDGTDTPKRRYMACSSSGGCSVIKTKPPAAVALRRLNWRELPLAN